MANVYDVKKNVCTFFCPKQGLKQNASVMFFIRIPSTRNGFPFWYSSCATGHLILQRAHTQEEEEREEAKTRNMEIFFSRCSHFCRFLDVLLEDCLSTVGHRKCISGLASLLFTVHATLFRPGLVGYL